MPSKSGVLMESSSWIEMDADGRPVKQHIGWGAPLYLHSVDRLRAKVRARLRFSARVILMLLPLAIALFLWKVPAWQLRELKSQLEAKETIELETALRTSWAQILGGAVLLVGLYLTWRRIAAAERTVEVSREAQITERFTRAIDQLGNSKLEIRLGGIYALERIARDSEKDHGTIMDILAAYVRENSRWKGQDAADQGECQRPAADVQAILTVIGRRTRTFGNGEMDALNLRGVDLRGGRFVDANLDGVDVSFSRLDGADFEHASLRRTLFQGCHLEKALFNGVEADLAFFVDCHLTEAQMHGNLKHAYFINAILAGASLRGADLRHAELRNAILTKTDLRGANLEEAYDLTAEQCAAALTDKDTILPVLGRPGLAASNLTGGRRTRIYDEEPS